MNNDGSAIKDNKMSTIPIKQKRNKCISKCCKAPIKYKVQVQGHYWADTEEEAQNTALEMLMLPN